MTSETLIKKYSLLPHPEGGWYKETYKSEELIAAGTLPNRFRGERFFQRQFTFFSKKETSPLFIVSKVMNAGTSMPVDRC